MYERTVQCALSSRQLAVILRDLARMINYDSAGQDIAVASPTEVSCAGWRALPKWAGLVWARRRAADLLLSMEPAHDVSPNDVESLLARIADGLSSMVGHPIRPFGQHVFCIGWHRTGTTSVTEALRLLGLFAWHFAPWVIGLKHRFAKADQHLPPEFSTIAEYTAVADLPVCALFKELDEAFPGSLFILTTRQTDTWMESVSNLAANLISHYGKVDPVMRWAYGIETIDHKIFRDRFVRHHEEVLEYFGERKDLLVIDVTREKLWTALCDFLRIPDPGVPFPHVNRRPVNGPSASNEIQHLI